MNSIADDYQAFKKSIDTIRNSSSLLIALKLFCTFKPVTAQEFRDLYPVNIAYRKAPKVSTIYSYLKTFVRLSLVVQSNSTRPKQYFLAPGLTPKLIITMLDLDLNEQDFLDLKDEERQNPQPLPPIILQPTINTKITPSKNSHIKSKKAASTQMTSQLSSQTMIETLDTINHIYKKLSKDEQSSS